MCPNVNQIKTVRRGGGENMGTFTCLNALYLLLSLPFLSKKLNDFLNLLHSSIMHSFHKFSLFFFPLYIITRMKSLAMDPMIKGQGDEYKIMKQKLDTKWSEKGVNS